MEDPDLLPFDPDGGGSYPVQYGVTHSGHAYYIRYRHSWLSIDCDDVEVFAAALAPEADDDGRWSDEETNVYLALISAAIRQNTLTTLQLPNKAEVAAHPFYCAGPLPRYLVMLCKKPGCSHLHPGARCYSDWTLSAKELHEWRQVHGDNFESHPSASNPRRCD